jgi:hypothetical protein
MAKCCENGNKPLCSVKGGASLDLLSNLVGFSRILIHGFTWVYMGNKQDTTTKLFGYFYFHLLTARKSHFARPEVLIAA